MIDHKNKLLFIHVPKNAGTSIERAVFKDCDFNSQFDYKYLRGYSAEHKINLQHATIEELLQYNFITEATLIDYNSFATVRNPFSRSISSYFWLLKDLKIEESFKNFLLQQGEFSDINLSRKDILVKDHMYTQSKFVMHNNSIGVKQLLRFENLPKSFNDYTRNLGINNELKSHYKKNKKKKLDVIKLLNKENIGLIQKRYEEDFVNFDYNMNFNKLKYFISNG